ncbi:MAG: hypothetical protein ABR531_08295, partial [Bacteroidales bacterium]
QSTGAASVTTVLSYIIEYGQLYYVFHSVAEEADFPNYAPIMESSMKTFARLTDPNRLNVKPDRIDVKTVQHTGTLASAFASYGVSQDMMNKLALLNNMELNDQVKAGKLIKIISK